MILAKVSNFLSLISSSRKSYGHKCQFTNTVYLCVSTSDTISIVVFFYRFRVLHKDFGASHLVLVVIHVDGAEEVKHPLLFRSPPVGPRLSC